MNNVIAVLCIVFSGIAFSGLAFAEMGGGSRVTVPHIICMQDGKMISTTAIPVTECNKLKAEKADNK